MWIPTPCIRLVSTHPSSTGVFAFGVDSSVTRSFLLFHSRQSHRISMLCVGKSSSQTYAKFHGLKRTRRYQMSLVPISGTSDGRGRRIGRSNVGCNQNGYVRVKRHHTSALSLHCERIPQQVNRPQHHSNVEESMPDMSRIISLAAIHET